MVVEYCNGDLFKQTDLAAVAHGANCRGVMSAGIAARFRQIWPQMFTEYRALCQADNFTPGEIFAWQAPSGVWIYNLATQYNPGRHATLQAVRDSVRAMLAHADAHQIPSIGLPRVGCGIGGLAFNDVRTVLEQEVAHRPHIHVRVVTPWPRRR